MPYIWEWIGFRCLIILIAIRAIPFVLTTKLYISVVSEMVS